MNELVTQDSSLFSVLFFYKKDALYQPTQSISRHTLVLCPGLVLPETPGQRAVSKKPSV